MGIISRRVKNRDPTQYFLKAVNWYEQKNNLVYSNAHVMAIMVYVIMRNPRENDHLTWLEKAYRLVENTKRGSENTMTFRDTIDP